jgi:hypothetical protein
MLKWQYITGKNFSAFFEMDAFLHRSGPEWRLFQAPFGWRYVSLVGRLDLPKFLGLILH